MLLVCILIVFCDFLFTATTFSFFEIYERESDIEGAESFLSTETQGTRVTAFQ